MALGAAALGGAAYAPAVAAAGGAAYLIARRKVMSCERAFNGQLDELLRESAARGAVLVTIKRFSKKIDRIASDFACLDSSPAADGRPLTTRQQVPFLHHSGVLLHLDAADAEWVEDVMAPRWIKVEFTREGLFFRGSPAEPPVERTFLVEACSLRSVSPLTVADCLVREQGRTYNALSWNCNHVTDMIWDTVVTNSSAGSDAPIVGLPPLSASLPPSLCIVCMERPKSILFVPCGHYCTCESCAAQLDTCPLCMQQIQQSQRVYE